MKWGFKKKEKRKNRPLPTDQLDELRKNDRLYGVKIHRSDCKACSHLAGKVFSFESAPKLPVNGCDAPVCNCEYLGVPERRQKRERRSDRDRREAIRMSSEECSGLGQCKEAGKRERFDRHK